MTGDRPRPVHGLHPALRPARPLVPARLALCSGRPTDRRNQKDPPMRPLIEVMAIPLAAAALATLWLLPESRWQGRVAAELAIAAALTGLGWLKAAQHPAWAVIEAFIAGCAFCSAWHIAEPHISDTATAATRKHKEHQ